MNMQKRIKRAWVTKGTILDVYKDTMELPNGKTEEWDFVSHRKGAAAVVAVREDGKLLMVRQYRNALERMTLEIPAGARDSVTEDTKCDIPEIEEETGYRSFAFTSNDAIDVPCKRFSEEYTASGRGRSDRRGST